MLEINPSNIYSSNTYTISRPNHAFSNDFYIYLIHLVVIPKSSILSTLLSNSVLYSPNRVLRYCFYYILLFLYNGLNLFSKWLVLNRSSIEHNASYLGAANDKEEEVYGSQTIILLANSRDIN
jgi:hypothetical protein